MSRQSATVLTPRCRWLDVISLAALTVSMAAGACAAPLTGTDRHPRPSVSAQPGGLGRPGLTEGTLPASESPAAMRTRRARAGSSTLILTDDLSMAAASTTLRISPAQAAVRSLVAGADVAMVCWAPVDGVTSLVAQAINDGRLPRQQAVTSARRVLSTKAQLAGPR